MNVIGVGRSQIRLTVFGAAMNKTGPGEFIPIRCDMAIEAEILRLVQTIRQKYDVIHILINNASESA